ncbi:M14 family metallopeptidase [Paenibacillus hexagrammi]|uniref:M14 family metallocarboxypeptidase n=1 Tax=Paenibacillus hexagrammi TaxID=2908839 RepID=A0ABY3SFF3_9BACL|nr:M14 family metallocarboxypeptidase [Paenibacillus sp. YPD9-1]UJF31647.1 M14 family metallocarboxypeptidase [Paenibacillus sp. YPD9-1]
MTTYGYLKLCDEMTRLCESYPFLRFQFIGQSVMGRNIAALVIGTGPRTIQYNAAFHANEWITTPLLMQFLEDLAKAYAQGIDWRGHQIRRLLAETTLWVIPMVNPDGVELVQQGVSQDHPFCRELLDWNQGSFDFRNWKANIRGVDLNDQFPAYWEVEAARRGQLGPGERDYGGTAPLTEPEAVALADNALSQCYEMIVALHTQGQEIYWNYRDYEPFYSETWANQLAAVSGYQAVKLSGSDAGYKDWFIQEFRKPGFTVEVGFGVNPLPVESLPVLYEEIVPLLLEGLELKI